MSVRAGGEKRPAGGLVLRVEKVTTDGVVAGFAYDPARALPAIVDVRHRGVLVAQARACVFRADLLAAGFSHGHHGFMARLRSVLPSGQVSLSVQVDGTDAGVVAKLVVPVLSASAPCRVEMLLLPPPTWTVSDFLARPDCMPWADDLARIGAARFVDAAFGFALARWPSTAEAGVHIRALSHGAVSAEGFLVQLLRSRERGDMPPALMSPFDPDFGVRIVPAVGKVSAAATAAPRQATTGARGRPGRASAR